MNPISIEQLALMSAAETKAAITHQAAALDATVREAIIHNAQPLPEEELIARRATAMQMRIDAVIYDATNQPFAAAKELTTSNF